MDQITGEKEITPLVHSFSIQDAVSTGFRLTRKYFWTMMGLGLIFMIPDIFRGLLEQIIILYVPEATVQTTGGGVVGYEIEFVGMWSQIIWVANLLLGALSLYLSIGLMRATIHIIQEQKPSFGIMRETPFKYFLRSAGASLISAIAVIGGVILLIIPGIYIAIRLSLAQYYIAEGYGMMDSLRASRSATKGNIRNLIGLRGANMLIMILGTLLLIVGLLRAMPTMVLAQAYVYRALKKNTPDSYHGEDEILPDEVLVP